MSTKYLFLTHDMNNAGKKMNNLPMTGGTCYQNSGFINTFSATCYQNLGFLCTLENNGKLIVENGK